MAVTAGTSISLTFDHADMVSAGKSQASGEDVRVVFWDGAGWTELDRMLETTSTWNSATTTIWFKLVRDIPASSSDVGYYLYYGNPTAWTWPPAPDSVFIFYDGFESKDFTRWTGVEAAAGDTIWAVTDRAYRGSYSARVTVDSQSPAWSVVWRTFADEESVVARAFFYLDPGFSTSNWVRIMQYLDTSAGWEEMLSLNINSDMTLFLYNEISGQIYGLGSTSPITTGAWHMLEMQMAAYGPGLGEARLWLDGGLEISVPLTDFGSERPDTLAVGIYAAGPDTEPNMLYFDEVDIRRWYASMAIATLGGEESSPCSATETPTPTPTPGG
jgi:hypothetical protein